MLEISFCGFYAALLPSLPAPSSGRGQNEVTEVTTGMVFWVIVSKQPVVWRSQEGMSHKRAGQAARGNVLPELKAQEVSEKRDKRVGKNN